MGELLVRVKAYPGARKEVFQKVAEHQYEAYVREPAEENRANKRILVLLARHYGITESQVRMRTGARTRGKTFTITLL